MHVFTRKIIASEDLTLLPKIKWSYPTDKELLKEIYSEYAIESLFDISENPKQEDYNQAISELKKVSTSKVLNPKNLKGKHIWDSYEDLKKTVESFGLPKDPDSMLAAIKKGEPLPMPIVIKHIDGDMEIAGGATRSGIARLADQPITALVIDERKANLKLADVIEKKLEKIIDEHKRQVYDQVKEYYLGDKEKPSFADRKDQIYAYVAEHHYRKIAKLRGLPVKDWIYTKKQLYTQAKKKLIVKALYKIIGEHVLPVAEGYKLKSTNNRDWELLDPENNIVVKKFIHMYHYKKDPPNVLSLIHPEDLPKSLRGKGLGVTSYLALAKHYGVIRSDTSLTEDGAKVWSRLIGEGATVISWDIEYATEEEALKKLDDMYGSVSPKAFYDPDTFYTRFELKGY